MSEEKSQLPVVFWSECRKITRRNWLSEYVFDSYRPQYLIDLFSFHSTLSEAWIRVFDFCQNDLRPHELFKKAVCRHWFPKLLKWCPLLNVLHPGSQRSWDSSLSLICHLHANNYDRLCILCLLQNTVKDPRVFKSLCRSSKMTKLFLRRLGEIKPYFGAWSGICTANYCFNSLSVLPN